MCELVSGRREMSQAEKIVTMQRCKVKLMFSVTMMLEGINSNVNVRLEIRMSDLYL